MTNSVLGKLKELFPGVGDITVLPDYPRMSYWKASGSITKEDIDAAVAAGNAEWQDPDHPDCELDPGSLYFIIVLPVDPEDAEGEEGVTEQIYVLVEEGNIINWCTP